MSHRQRVNAVALWLAVSSVGLILAANLILFYVNLIEEQEHLSYLVKSQARLIESVAQFDEVYSDDFPGGAFEATLRQVVDANAAFEGFGETGEFTMAELDESEINFLFNPRLASGSDTFSVPLDSDLAEPMRRALMGQSGVMIGRDYRGDWVVAAYEPVMYLEWGLVAKVDLLHVMSPYAIALIIIATITTLLIRTGQVRFLAATDPVLNELSDTNQRYLHALRKTETLTFEQDAQLRYTHLFHPSFQEHELEVYGKTDDEVFPNDEANTLKDIKQTVLAADLNVRDTVSMTFGTQTYMMDLIVEPKQDESGKSVGLFGSATNITPLIEAKINAEFQAQLLQSVREAIVYCDLEGYIKYWGAGAEKQYGLSAVGALGKHVSIFIAPSHQKADQTHLENALKSGSWRGRVRHINQSGKVFWAETFISLVTNQDGDPIGFIGINRDIHNVVVAEEDRQRSLDRLEALRKIDKSITRSSHIDMILGVLIEQIQTNLAVDAVAILIKNEFGQLAFAAGTGFTRTNTDRIESMNLEAGPAIDAMHKNQPVEFFDRDKTSIIDKRFIFVRDESFASYIAVPLVAQGEPLGVLELFHHSLLEPEPNWREFLETLAEQASIALHSSKAVESLRQTKRDLEIAYAATLEGWSSALELRDSETAGHSQRVTEMTLRLAVSLGIPTEELIHISRGSLLHDIGKMGIPDAILNKPGPLDDKEWEIMKTHPLLAHQLLSKITYLRPALEIPMWHHERWDGSGYPHRLKGEEIPLSARIFAVVDTWDALCSDRPYRKAWDEEEVLEYLRQESGTLYDPLVVEAFLELNPNHDH